MSTIATTEKEQLLKLLRKRAYIRRDVVLSSGEPSDYYIDGKMIEVFPEGAYLIGEVLYQSIEDVKCDAVGGLAVGAIPLVTSLAISCHHHARLIEGFFVREERKEHGTKKLIEGNLPPNARVVIVDDVVTSGRSVQKAIDVVTENGAHVERVVAIVDRERGATEMLERQGYRYDHIFTTKDLEQHNG